MSPNYTNYSQACITTHTHTQYSNNSDTDCLSSTHDEYPVPAQDKSVRPLKTDSKHFKQAVYGCSLDLVSYPGRLIGQLQTYTAFFLPSAYLLCSLCAKGSCHFLFLLAWRKYYCNMLWKLTVISCHTGPGVVWHWTVRSASMKNWFILPSLKLCWNYREQKELKTLWKVHDSKLWKITK